MGEDKRPNETIESQLLDIIDEVDRIGKHYRAMKDDFREETREDYAGATADVLLSEVTLFKHWLEEKRGER